jgi:hypothetical protein
MRRRIARLCALSGALALSLSAVSLAAEPKAHGDHLKAFGAVSKATDPENPSNQVFKFDNTSTFAGITTQLEHNIKVHQLDNQVQLKYYFVSPKTCILGSPRIQLAIDTDHDGKSNGNAFGYLGDKPFGGGCAMDQWVFEDMTDGAAKWDLSQFGGGMTNTWDQMEAFFDGTFPNHQVLSSTLVEDPGSATPGSSGITYYDTVTMADQTADNWNDVSDLMK